MKNKSFINGVILVSGFAFITLAVLHVLEATEIISWAPPGHEATFLGSALFMGFIGLFFYEVSKKQKRLK